MIPRKAKQKSGCIITPKPLDPFFSKFKRGNEQKKEELRPIERGDVNLGAAMMQDQDFEMQRAEHEHIIERRRFLPQTGPQILNQSKISLIRSLNWRAQVSERDVTGGQTAQRST